MLMLNYFMQMEMQLKEMKLQASNPLKKMVYSIKSKYIIHKKKNDHLLFFTDKKYNAESIVGLAQFIDYAKKIKYITDEDLPGVRIKCSSFDTVCTGEFFLPANEDDIAKDDDFVPSLEIKAAIRHADMNDTSIHIIRTFKKANIMNENKDTERFEVVTDSVNYISYEKTCADTLISNAYNLLNNVAIAVVEKVFDSVSERFKL